MANLTKCKTCGKSISENINSCPHCGEKNPIAIDLNRPVSKKDIKELIIGLLVAILVLSYVMGGDTTKENKKAINIDNEKKEIRAWYSNGTLHQSSIKEWKLATSENKLATSADWIMSVNKSIEKKVTDSGTMDTLMPYSIELVSCIDTAISDNNTADSENSTTIAVLCMSLLKYD
jgi:hypothetical protein